MCDSCVSVTERVAAGDTETERESPRRVCAPHAGVCLGGRRHVHQQPLAAVHVSLGAQSH